MAHKFDEGTLVTGRSSHEVYVVRDGVRRWVPDAWTMQSERLSPADIRVVDDTVLADLPGGDPLPSTVPAPRVASGDIIETEDGVFVVTAGKLARVVDPRDLLEEGRPPSRVTFFPASLCRSLYQTESGV